MSEKRVIFIGKREIISNSAGSCWVLVGPCRVLVGPSWVLVGTAGYCWVLGGSLVGTAGYCF